MVSGCISYERWRRERSGSSGSQSGIASDVVGVHPARDAGHDHVMEQSREIWKTSFRQFGCTTFADVLLSSLTRIHRPFTHPFSRYGPVKVDRQLFRSGEVFVFRHLEGSPATEDLEKGDLDTATKIELLSLTRSSGEQLTPKAQTSERRSSWCSPLALCGLRYSGVPQQISLQNCLYGLPSIAGLVKAVEEVFDGAVASHL